MKDIVLIISGFVFLCVWLWILTSTADGRTVRLMASEQLQVVPQLHFLVEGEEE